MAAAEQSWAQRHEIRDAVAAIADEFVEHTGYQGEGFGAVETHAAGETSLGKEAQVGDREFVELMRWGKRSVIGKRS
jgi:hypothetical protein